MKPRNDEQKLTKAPSQAKTPRFKIVKLEERIAPAKGGIPGPPSCPAHFFRHGYCVR